MFVLPYSFSSRLVDVEGSLAGSPDDRVTPTIRLHALRCPRIDSVNSVRVPAALSVASRPSMSCARPAFCVLSVVTFCCEGKGGGLV